MPEAKRKTKGSSAGEREGEDLREEFKSSAVSTDEAMWPWGRTTRGMRKESWR